MVNAIYVLEQAEKNERFLRSDRATRRFNFSHLYTALSRSQYRDYLGLKTAWAHFKPEPDPVAEENLDKLGKVLTWIYGSKEKDVPPVIKSQNPDIKRLGEVLASPKALVVLESRATLAEAHADTQSARKRLSEALVQTPNAHSRSIEQP